MVVVNLSDWLKDRSISTGTLAKEIGIDRQKLDYWLSSDATIQAYIDNQGQVSRIKASRFRTLYERKQ